MTIFNNIYYKLLLFFILLGILITGCQASNKYPVQESSITSQPYFNLQNSEVVYTTMEEITSKADLIIIGQAISKNGIINSNRDPNDPMKPDSEYFSIGQVYTVAVSSYIKGKGPTKLNLILYQGHVSKNISDLTENDIEQASQEENIIPIALNQRYVMFLRYISDNYIDFPETIYTGLAHPWLFQITAKDCVQPEDEETDLYLYFPAQPLNDFIQFTNNPTNFPEVPYPVPLNPNRCPEESISATPYP